MERKLASIQRIVSLSPIPNADMIEKATVLGWELVVAKKDNFKVGDLVIYCEVDSILPDRPEFEFLRDRKFRIKTIKLKGQVSQGICFPVSLVHKTFHTEGRDVTEILGVKKYDPQAEFERKELERLTGIDKNRMDKFLKRYSWYRKLIFKPTKTPFPAFIRKTDEDRIQLFPNACEQWKDVLFEVTEKIDGQSATYFCIPNPKRGLFRNKWIFGVCSRNFQLVREDNSSYWTIAKQENLKEKMIKWCDVENLGLIIQGEIIGCKIQGNKYRRNGYEFYLFNGESYDKGKKQSFTQQHQSGFAATMGLKTVPWLYSGQKLPYSIPLAVDSAKGKSVLADVLREGIVVRNYSRNISFKIINPDFLLKYAE
jgi:hypothetical protein